MENMKEVKFVPKTLKNFNVASHSTCSKWFIARGKSLQSLVIYIVSRPW